MRGCCGLQDWVRAAAAGSCGAILLQLFWEVRGYWGPQPPNGLNFIFLHQIKVKIASRTSCFSTNWIFAAIFFSVSGRNSHSHFAENQTSLFLFFFFLNDVLRSQIHGLFAADLLLFLQPDPNGCAREAQEGWLNCERKSFWARSSLCTCSLLASKSFTKLRSIPWGWSCPGVVDWMT